MEYKIIAFDETIGQITVEHGEGIVFALDLPIENGAYPVGDELDVLIKQFLPTWVVERKQSIASGIRNIDGIKSLVVAKEEQSAPTQVDSCPEGECPMEYMQKKYIETMTIPKYQRKAMYKLEADSIFFKAQRGEATMEEWLAKVAEIKERYPDERAD